MKNLLSSNVHKKPFNAFLRMTQAESFEKKVEALMKKYEIPNNGFAENKRSDVMKIPAAWKFSKNRIIIHNFEKELRKICRDYGFEPSNWMPVLRFYVFYNKTIAINADLQHALCHVYAAGHEPKNLENNFYPLVIRVSPYASQRDVLDFIRITYPRFKNFLNYFKKKDAQIGKVRSGSKESRNDFIFKNRHLSHKKLEALVAENFGEYIDYAHIGVIISQRLKQKKV